MLSRFLRKYVLLLIMPLIAVPILAQGYNAVTWNDPQKAFYNAGLEAYKAGDLSTAVDLFQQSLKAYDAESQDTRFERLLHGEPSAPLASRANLHIGVALLVQSQAFLLGDPELVGKALDAFKASIALNPGAPFLEANIQSLTAEALKAQYDLELLFQKNVKQSQKGKKPKPGDGNKRDAAPQNGDPIKVPGKGEPEGI